MKKRQLKNTTCNGSNLVKMNDDTYKLRRTVIDCLYELKRMGYELPRIEIRVVENSKGSTAYAYLGKNIIHVDKRWIDNNIFVRTLHEIGHATFGLTRIEGCLLMHCENWKRYSVPKEDVLKVFDKYYKQYKNK